MESGYVGGVRARSKMVALYVVCAGVLMILLDTTIVTVALPAVMADLRVTGTALTWTVNAYMLTYGGFLILGGRLGDLYGKRRLFLLGIAGFTLASLLCGLAENYWVLLVARAVQGAGGAVVTATALSLIASLFPDETDRARAIAVYGFVCAGGGSAGEILGGVLTQLLSWHWIFLVNLPVGAGIYLLGAECIPADPRAKSNVRLDVPGALLVTASQGLLVAALVDEGGPSGRMSSWLLAMGSVGLMLALGVVEHRALEPLLPSRLIRLRHFVVGNALCLLWASGTFAWFVIAALYLQRVLGYSPLKVGLAFLPATMTMGLFSLGLSARAVDRFGIRNCLWAGFGLAAIGLTMFTRISPNGAFATEVLPAMTLLGIAGGIAYGPILLVAMVDIGRDDEGLASGITNTSYIVGGMLGVAVLSRLAEAQTVVLAQRGIDEVRALGEGYEAAFMAGAILTLLGACLGGLAVRRGRS